jgi:hypothetical protein
VIETDEMPDLMRQDALDVEFVRLAARGKRKYRIEDNVGLLGS